MARAGQPAFEKAYVCPHVAAFSLLLVLQLGDAAGVTSADRPQVAIAVTPVAAPPALLMSIAWTHMSIGSRCSPQTTTGQLADATAAPQTITVMTMLNDIQLPVKIAALLLARAYAEELIQVPLIVASPASGGPTGGSASTALHGGSDFRSSVRRSPGSASSLAPKCEEQG